MQKRILQAFHAGVAHAAAHDLAQDVTAALVGGHDAIVNQEGGGAGMVGADVERGRFHGLAEERLRPLANGLE